MLTESRWVSTLFFPFRGLDNGVNLNTLRRWFVMKGGESAQISNPMISMVYSYLIPGLGRVVIGSHISFFCQL
jgi:hypothetical protein